MIAQGKIEMCKRSIVESYNENKIVDRFVNRSLQLRTDGSYVQIGLKHVIDAVWFTDPSYSPLFGDLGKAVADGEVGYLVKTLSDDRLLTKNKIDKAGQFNLLPIIKTLFASKHFDPRNTVILSPLHVEWENFEDVGVKSYYDSGSLVVDVGVHKIPIFGFRQDIIGNKIMVLDKRFGIWNYIRFKNFDNINMDDIDVSIGHTHENFYVTTRALVKLEIMDRKSVYIFEITDIDESTLYRVNKKAAEYASEVDVEKVTDELRQTGDLHAQ